MYEHMYINNNPDFRICIHLVTSAGIKQTYMKSNSYITVLQWTAQLHTSQLRWTGQLLKTISWKIGSEEIGH